MLEVRPFVVANWKMYTTYKESIVWCEENLAALTQLAQKAEIILCPTFPALEQVGRCAHASNSKLGAQNCSWKNEGALTGEVSVASLKELRCSYCIVGHSERRQFCGETNDQIAQKLALLLEAKITPILCVGETAKGISWEQQKPILEQVVTDQLSVVTDLAQAQHRTICIAYEPVWAIGSGQVPTVEHIEGAFACIRHFCQVYLAGFTVHLLYGGSVDPETVQSLWQVKGLEGFLIGGASVDFKSFQKIVQSHR